jgi:hypothetical protein
MNNIVNKPDLLDRLNKIRLHSNNTKSYIDLSDSSSIIQYIINNYEKFLLLVVVVVIVYCIDHINNINAAIYGVVQIPGISSTTSATTQQPTIVKSKSTKTKSKKSK